MLNYQRVMMLDVLFKPNINIHQNFGPQIKANLSEFDHFKVGLSPICRVLEHQAKSVA